MTPSWAKSQWYEVHYRSPHNPSGEYRIDRRRRTKATCERIADEMRASGNFLEVWLVEVNGLTRGPDPWKMRRG